MTTNSNIHLLLIEDNPADARIIHEYLTFGSSRQAFQAFQVFQSSTLKGGYEILENEHIDIILLDLNLPDSLGIKSFDSLIETFPDHPVIVLTGFSDESIGLAAVNNGAQDYLSKDDLNPANLMRCINYGMMRHQMLNRLEQAQRMAKMGSWEYYPKEERVYCNTSGCVILQIEEQTGGLEIQSCFHLLKIEDRRSLMASIANAILHKSSFKIDAQTLLEGKQKQFLAITGTVEYKKGSKDMVIVGTVQDVTDRMEREELIREKELAIKSSQLKQEFLANTSHEIRTPLNAILQLTRILLDADPQQEQVKYLNLIKNAGSSLLAVINDVLDFSKIEAGKMDFSKTPFELYPLIDSVIAILELKANEERVKLNKFVDADIPRFLIGDPVRLNQILINLVNNAIKYTQDGFINIMIRLVSRNENEVLLEFCVEDTGIGIPEDKLEVIFQGFRRLDTNLNRKYSGTGLGLTIVEQLVKLQGGNIRAESEMAKGSKFIFTLPFSAAKVQELQKKAATIENGMALAGKRVLMVEDNLLNQMVTEHLLRTWGIEVSIATNGKIAIEMLQNNPYDLVLMDLQMPVMDGYETTRFIRNKFASPLKDIPIIALTANAFSGMDDECLRVGMNDYISKPFEKGVLFHKMKAIMPVTLGTESNGNFSHFSQNNPVSESAKSSEGQDIKLIDMTYLREISGDDDMIFNLAINKYLENTPDSLELIEELLAEKDYEELARAIHKLKSSVATMGMHSTKERIIEAEHIIKNDLNKAQLVESLDQVVQDVELSFDELKFLLGRELSN